MSWLDRTSRPLMRQGGALYVLGGVIFLVLAGGIFLKGMYHWSEGQPIDMVGFGALLASMGGAATTITGIVRDLNRARHSERVEEIRAGAAPPPLAIPSPPPSDGGDGQSPTGGLVNNQAIE